MINDLKQNIFELIEETDAAGVKLIAVTKTVPVEIINEAISYGVKCIGENKVQELLEKYDSLNKDNLEIHLIGRLQSNKVKYIIDKVDLIHSVDSVKLAATIDKYAKNHDKIQDILVQVNIAMEETKGGVAADEVVDFVRQISDFKNIKVRGLMCIPTPELIEGENAKYFDLLHKMFVDINNEKIDNVFMDILSMGMSNDYKTAIKCGTTAVRVGTKIFGKRNYKEI